MAFINKHGKLISQDKYKQAFIEHTKAKKNQFKFKWIEYAAFASWKDKNYMIRHVDDVANTYRSIFEKEEYNEICLYSSAALWQDIIDEIGWERKDIVIAVYRQWTIYWQKNEKDFRSNGTYDRMRKESWEELLILIELIKLDPASFAESADTINEIVFRPIIAMSILDHYDDIDIFIDKVIEYLVEDHPDIVSEGFPSEVIYLEGETENETETFFVYETDLEFKEVD